VAPGTRIDRHQEGQIDAATGSGVMSLTLCVLLWARPGAADALAAYEDQVLGLVPEHGGQVLQRARGNGEPGQPQEIQFLEFPSATALDEYMADDRRTALAHVRDRAIARTQVINVELIPPAPDPGTL
jgi:uncharacterized protein (DUF1330 family)